MCVHPACVLPFTQCATKGGCQRPFRLWLVGHARRSAPPRTPAAPQYTRVACIKWCGVYVMRDACRARADWRQCRIYCLVTWRCQHDAPSAVPHRRACVPMRRGPTIISWPCQCLGCVTQRICAIHPQRKISNKIELIFVVFRCSQQREPRAIAAPITWDVFIHWHHILN